MPIGWRAAMSAALYGEAGFFVAGAGPAAHFRTSAHGVPVLATAVLRLLDRVDAALGRPDRLDVVDVGAGRGELLTTLVGLAPPELAARLRPTAVELAPRPAALPATVDWRPDPPERVAGLLLGTEWLDNVPLEVATPGPTGWRRVLVDPATGAESIGGPVDAAEADWLARWWPVPAHPGPADRAEIGLSRDAAWASTLSVLERGLALAVDYGHLRDGRPPAGTLTGFRAGRQVPPVPDGSSDLTAHVAVDAVGTAGAAVAGTPYTLVRQRAALRALGADGARPALALAATDPAGYVRALARASTAAELTDPAGLGAHWWLLQPVDVDPPAVLPPGL
ncbi:SAM-dependent methyltransferase [Plantactinospora sp. CA-290183]|uniref:SAM-dependent methyltransferase n=1 Tax=Plantactinospora sp. CA-290183 TaxID=3240006 RepID=UPI003D948FE5